MMSSAGTSAIKLFSLEKGYGLEEMAWSPDGGRLAYMKSHGAMTSADTSRTPGGVSIATSQMAASAVTSHCGS